MEVGGELNIALAGLRPSLQPSAVDRSMMLDGGIDALRREPPDLNSGGAKGRAQNLTAMMRGPRDK